MSEDNTRMVRFIRNPGDPLSPRAQAELQALPLADDGDINIEDIPELKGRTWTRPGVGNHPAFKRASETRVPETLDVKAIREGLHLTQNTFAQTFGLSLEFIQDWEAGRRVPEASTRVLLAVIAHDHTAVIKALDNAFLLPINQAQKRST